MAHNPLEWEAANPNELYRVALTHATAHNIRGCSESGSCDRSVVLRKEGGLLVRMQRAQRAAKGY